MWNGLSNLSKLSLPLSLLVGDFNTIVSYTWCNGQLGCAHHWAHLDRFLANMDWISMLDTYNVHHLSHVISDHAPLILKTPVHFHSKSKIFQFENFWLDNKGCHDSI